MNKSNHEPVFDWQALYNCYNGLPAEILSKNGRADYWNGRACSYAQKTQHSRHRENADALLNQFEWKASERVLDVGCGPGSFALPLARRVKEVVAFDVSAEMLQHLDQQAKDEGVENIKTMQGSWLDADPSLLVGFDTVLCFNAVGVVAARPDGQKDIVETLRRLKTAARRGLMLVSHNSLPVDDELRQLLEIDDSPDSRERVAMLYLIMVKQGLFAQVKIVNRPFLWVFSSLEEGLAKMAQRFSLGEDEKKTALLEDYLKRRLKESCGSLILEYPVAQTLFCWQND